MATRGRHQKKRMTRKVTHTGRAKQCQCDRNCSRPSLKESAFCSIHQRCQAGSPLSYYEPNYEPGRWNQRKFKLSHNCFSYGMNVIDPKQVARCQGECNVPFHQPGLASGHDGFSDKPKTCSNMITRIIGDNPLIKMSRFQYKCPAGSSKVAFVADESEDYHFLRQDSNGYWSHKPGARSVTNRDSSNRPIWNPGLADFNYAVHNSNLNYDLLCGYLCVPRNRKLHLKASS